MKATVNRSEIQITLTMTREELNHLREGIGNTSQDGRVEVGMTEEQSKFMGEFYELLYSLKI